jgi:ADP-ribosylglycohydrolase
MLPSRFLKTLAKSMDWVALINALLNMLGSIIGDIIGSAYEFDNAGEYDFDPFPEGSSFTDDTVLTIAVADAILQKKPYGEMIWHYGNRYPGRGYGGMFQSWLSGKDMKPYNSFGNGSAMRVSPVGWAFDSLEATIREAGKSAECTHNHPEGKKGAEATAAAIFLARNGASKSDIKSFITIKFGYNLERTLDEIRPLYSFNETCQKTVPEAITCFLESESFEDSIRKAIWLGGDSDTIACITGGIAEAFYREMNEEWVVKATKILPAEMLKVIDDFRRAESQRYPGGSIMQ